MSKAFIEQRHKGLGELELSSAERRIFMFIRNNSGSSRAEISRELGLAKATVTRAMTKLQKHNLVEEQREKARAAQMGQPNIRIKLKHTEVLTIGINLSTRGCCAAVADLNCAPIWIGPLRPLAQGKINVVRQINELVLEALGRADGRANDIGLFVPALFDSQSEIFEVTPSQQSVPYELVLQELRSKFEGFKITPSGRADLLYHALEPKNYGKVIFHLSCADGVGGQIFDRDRPFLGGFNMAGNIGGLVPETGPRPSVLDLAKTIDLPEGEISEVKISDLLAASDPKLLEWLRSRSAVLSTALSALVQLVNPSQLVFGGNLPNVLLDELGNRVTMNEFDVPGRLHLPKPKIETSTILGEEQRALAAASIPLAKFAFSEI